MNISLMSFGNRSSYASLKDAFGVSEFTSQLEPSYNIPQKETQLPVVSPVAEVPIIEKFSETEFESDVTCGQVKSHCDTCGCIEKKENRTWINEILNLILIGLLLWILVYKPAN
jgi:hypothetical protein